MANEYPFGPEIRLACSWIDGGALEEQPAFLLHNNVRGTEFWYRR